MQTPWKQTPTVEEWGVVTSAGTFTPRSGVSSLAGDPPPGSGPLLKNKQFHQDPCDSKGYTHTHVDDLSTWSREDRAISGPCRLQNHYHKSFHCLHVRGNTKANLTRTALRMNFRGQQPGSIWIFNFRYAETIPPLLPLI